MTARIDLPSDRIAEFCERWGVRKMSLFGSAIRDDFTPESDVDVLVEFIPGTRRGMARLYDMPTELSGIFGRDVDICTAQELSKYFRDRVLAEAEEIYVAP